MICSIAYAICENECRASWVWFLEALLDDVGKFDIQEWVFISDHQKVSLYFHTLRVFNVFLPKLTYKSCNVCCFQVLLHAFDILLPHMEYRYCIKHLHANMKSHGWKGHAYKDVL